MTSYIQSDVAVLGGGLGGYVAAIRASQFGSKVILVERDKLGGTCANKGCIPTKTLLSIGRTISDSRRLADFNFQIDSSKLDFEKIMKEANAIAGEVSKNIEDLLKKNEVEVIKGSGSLLDHKTISVAGVDGDTTIIESSAIIIATGSSPFIPPIPGSDDERVITSDNVFDNYDKPEKLAIVGAGAVGLEWGTIYNNFGTEVTIIEMMPQILPREDEEIAGYLKGLLEEEGIKIISGTKVNGITSSGDELTVHLEGMDKIHSDLVFLAVGRVPNTSRIGLAGLVDINKDRIVVDSHMRTKTENIFAVGDVVGRWMLAHVAMHEGLAAGENAVGGDVEVKYDAVPRCVYTDPEAAFVGLSEKEASKQIGRNVKTSFFPLRANGRAKTMRRIKGGIKLVYEKEYGELLGAQIVAPHASELVGELSLAIHLEATLEDLANTPHAHPTLSEILWENALRGLGRELHI